MLLIFHFLFPIFLRDEMNPSQLRVLLPKLTFMNFVSLFVGDRTESILAYEIIGFGSQIQRLHLPSLKCSSLMVIEQRHKSLIVSSANLAGYDGS